ncbi:MAG: beta-galactosidase trimerization domain-containing protein [Candidatus Omnitrophica bacterium]|nr:beta-galactosidase trimerization domain-containing protein [Candidatus Omnitrophota bacterium]
MNRAKFLWLFGLLGVIMVTGVYAELKPNSATDRIRIQLQDAQTKGQPGFGVASVGDKLLLELNTSTRCKKVVFRLLDTRAGKPIIIDGRTEFPAPYNPDSSGQSWLVTVPVTEASQSDFKTGAPKSKTVPAGIEGIQVVAEVEGGSYSRLVTVPTFGFDLTVGRTLTAAPVEQTPDALLIGKTLLESDFNQGEDPQWKVVAGNQWTYLRNRFGDTSDSYGPDLLGNWAVAGQEEWTDYNLSADMAEQMDGLGLFTLAVRFQNPRNYYGLEWSVGETAGNLLRLVRCKDGQRFEIAQADGLVMDKLPLRLGISVSGDYLSGTLNGKTIVSGYAGDFASGPVAIGEKSRMVLADNIKVVQIISPGKKSRFFSDFKVKYTLAPRYFLRDAGIVELPFSVTNTGKEPFAQARLQIAFDAYLSSPEGIDIIRLENMDSPSYKSLLAPLNVDIPRLEPGNSITIKYALDTRLLKQGEYILKIRSNIPGEQSVYNEVIPIGIARNWNPDRFNYFSWGLPDNSNNIEADLKDYAEHGHTMGMAASTGGRGTQLDWQNNGNPIPEANRPKSYGPNSNPARFSPLDYCLKYGLIAGVNLQSNHGSFFPDEMHGKTKNNASQALLPYHPKFYEYSLNLARTYARQYSAYPACRLFNINSETEYELQPDFSELGLARSKRLFGAIPPEGCTDNTGIPGSQVPGLITNGIVDDNHPVARYYHWFWLEGEGWNVIDREMAKVIREVSPDTLVFHDPADRMPFIRDRHDGINPWDWTYTTPGPLNMVYKTEVLRALAKSPNDKIFNSVQVLWKATVLSPQDECPSAAVIRLGLLYSTSRPVYAAGHWNTDWMRNNSNLDRWEAVKDLSESFWKPLGPVITSLQTDAPREVAFLVSSNNQLFRYKNRGSIWSWEAAFAAWNEAFLRAGLPVDIIFEESVAEGKLAKYKAVFIPCGELIGKSAYDQLIAYAKNGGKVVADNTLGYNVPGVTILKSDSAFMDYYRWVFSSATRLSAPDRAKMMGTVSDEIAGIFAEYRAKLPTADNKQLIVNTRLWEDIPYIFAINDNRSAGTQVGQYGVMLENGEPLTASITLPLSRGSRAVYDLVEHRKVETTNAKQGLRWSKQYAPASGTLFAVLPQEIAGLEVTVPDKPVAAGQAFTITARLLDAGAKPVRGRLPLRLTIRDGQGSVSEYSDVFAFTNGQFKKSGFIARNDMTGTWSVQIDDLASGRSVTKYFQATTKQ